MRPKVPKTDWIEGSLLQQPGPKKFKLLKIELIYKAQKFIKFPRSLSKKDLGKAHISFGWDNDQNKELRDTRG